jgi:dihydrodipicolinate synthase/N-acetylneuraminate lyase
MIAGVYVANVTPFGTNGNIDVDAYVAHVEWLAQQGVQGVVPFGTNGEGPSVTLREKLAVLEALFARQLPIQIIPTVAQGNLPESLEMVHALNGWPATAIMVLPPFYFKPVASEGLRRFFEPILAASQHPVMLYHIPKYAVPIPPELVIELPVWGVKDSGGEPGYAETLLRADRKVLSGTEEDVWKRLASGVQGMISALANFIPEHIVEVYQRFQAGDEEAGKRRSAQLQPIRAMTKEYASPGVLKKLAQARHGTPMGTVRPPLVPVPDNYDPRPVLEQAEVDAWKA